MQLYPHLNKMHPQHHFLIRGSPCSKFTSFDLEPLIGGTCLFIPKTLVGHATMVDCLHQTFIEGNFINRGSMCHHGTNAFFRYSYVNQVPFTLIKKSCDSKLNNHKNSKRGHKWLSLQRLFLSSLHSFKVHISMTNLLAISRKKMGYKRTIDVPCSFANE